MLEYHLNDSIPEAGCDEAGRGCLAGPVYAAAVILPSKCRIDGLNDSKKLSEKKRNFLRTQIESQALGFAVESVSPERIDEINILNASILAMHLALDKLVLRPEFILVDGNRFKPYNEIPYRCVVGGDGKYMSIAAASVLAKTYRDEYMEKLHRKYPQYGWMQNKGYPTKSHRDAIMLHGPTPFHRTTFKLTNSQLTMKFPPNRY